MTVARPNERFRRQVRGFYAWVGSVIYAGAAPVLAAMLIDRHTATGRITGLILGSSSWIPWAWIVTRIIRAGDEFQRQLHLAALAIAFGASLVVLMVLDWAARADFIRAPPLKVLWLTFWTIWLVSLIVVKRRFERTS